MRSYAFLALFAILLPMALANPAIGAYLWAWLSLMNPHRLTYGFTMHLPFAQMVAIATLLGLVFTRRRRGLPINSVLVLLILFVGWMTFTGLFALNPSRDEVFEEWLRMFKIHVMLLVTLAVVFERSRIDTLIWVIVGSLAFYGVKGGLWTLITGGGGRVWGPPGGVVQGNNELGVALVVVMPLMYYLASNTRSRHVRWGLLAALAITGVAALGTQSRGALLAIGVITFFLGVKSGRPWLTTFAGIVALGLAAAFMPDSWVERMRTISPDQLDSSALSRLATWSMIWHLALDRPLVGGGFAFTTPETYSRYSPQELDVAYAPHSIYFQALGEHGFVGLFLFLALGIATWRTASRLIARAKDDPELAWAASLMRMVQVSLIGFAVGGAFLGLVHFDLPYYLCGLVILVDRELRSAAEQAKRSIAGAAPTAPPSRQPPERPLHLAPRTQAPRSGARP